jgi:hypothetical protein
MTRGVFLAGLASACLFLAAGGGLAQPASKDVVKLGFCWPPGLKAQVTNSSVRSQTGAQTRSSTFRYTLSVLEQGANLRVRLDDPVADLSAAGAQVSAEVQARVDEQLEETLPDFLITPDGKLVGLVDVEGYQARLRGMIERRLPKNVDRAAAKKAIDGSTSEAALNARLAQQWHVLVGSWVGGELPIGVEHTRQTKVGPAEKPIGAISHSYGAARRVPCRRGGKARECVQLFLRSVPDDAAMNARIGQLTTALGQRLPPMTRVKSAASEEAIQLVAEPECLVPHSFTRTQTQTLVVEQGVRESTITRQDRSAITYSYE